MLQTDEYQDRLNRLEMLKKLKIDPYPSKVQRDYYCKDFLDNFEKLIKKQKNVYLVGRIRNIRLHGKLCFIDIADESSKLQIVIMKSDFKNFSHIRKDSYNTLVQLLDIGDFIQVSGIPYLTKRGEKSIKAITCKILAKSLRPLPDKWSGFKNEEERFRKRYLDILFNPEVKDLIIKKSKFWNSVRQFMQLKGFLEVETPVLENTAGGADARPFVTHHNALNIDVYLRISMGELWQKRLMIAGFEKVFEIGRQFRNEGMDSEHLQDYTQMEFYWAYADYEKGMKLVEELFKYIAKQTFGTLKFRINKFDIDLNKKWKKYDYVKTVKKYTGIDILNSDIKQIELKLKELNIKYDKRGFNITRAIDNLWKYCRKKIAGPGFLINLPVKVSPLAKILKNSNSLLTQRFQVLIAGSELGNGYSELNDPIDQAKRFKEQQKLRDKGDQEAQMYDYEFVQALEYGMPPTCGFGMSERVFSFLSNRSARECQIFPLMRPENKSI